VGKYHAACFTCSNESCRIPLTGPESDGSFHVFEGAPFCEYHYHMANQSLCAAKSCGRPIDGPCIQVCSISFTLALQLILSVRYTTARGTTPSISSAAHLIVD